ncbi:hypothetical protein [Streptomyces sp. URMC 125]|uniref:hypothetical protein n=1 Tax=Streptomyces sp. URMC 125 TaxID=3423419 RepID=UPI003F1BB4AB
MIFHFDRERAPTAGKLLYLGDEQSFFFEEYGVPAGLSEQQNRADITVGPVDLSVSLATGALLFATGYAPRRAWKSGEVTPPPYRAGSVRVSGMDSIPGMAVSVDDMRHEVVLDGSTGWVRVTGAAPTSDALLFAEGTVLGIDGAGHFSGLWMKPEFTG